jgi:hypothetical protein
VPAAQGAQEVAPVEDEYRPAAHAMHAPEVDAPLDIDIVPALQLKQATAPVLSS